MKTLVHASVFVPRQGRFLVVREGKESNRGQWNLPGGHLDPGENVIDAARRETREETGLEVLPANLVGVYTGLVRWGNQSIRFVFRGTPVAGEESPGDDILETRWVTVDEIRSLPDEELVAPEILRRILDDLEAGIVHPITVLREPRGGC